MNKIMIINHKSFLQNYFLLLINVGTDFTFEFNWITEEGKTEFLNNTNAHLRDSQNVS